MSLKLIGTAPVEGTEYECEECDGHFIGDDDETAFPSCPYCKADSGSVVTA